MIALDTLPSEPTVVDRHTALLAECDGFNREAIALLTEAEELRPLSVAFEDLGKKLDAVLKAGLENLDAAQMKAFRTRLAEMQEFRRHFEPRLNALLARQKAHVAHEADLMRRLRELNLLAGPLTATLSNN